MTARSGCRAVLAAKRLGAEQIILMGRHKARTDLGREFGATDVVAERGEEGIAQVRELTGGDGTHAVLECVGHCRPTRQAFGVVRAGGVISRVGVPQYEDGADRVRQPVRAATSPSPAASPRPAPTSRSCCPTSSTARSSRARSSTAPSASTGCPTATAPWPTARRSRCWSARERVEQTTSSARIGEDAGEIDIATRRGDGTLRSARIVWVVRNGDALYVRSVNGPDAAWYRGVQTRMPGGVTAGGLGRDVTFVEAGQHAGTDGLDDTLDEAYRAKYGRWSGAGRAHHRCAGPRDHPAPRPRLNRHRTRTEGER